MVGIGCVGSRGWAINDCIDGGIGKFGEDVCGNGVGETGYGVSPSGGGNSGRTIEDGDVFVLLAATGGSEDVPIDRAGSIRGDKIFLILFKWFGGTCGGHWKEGVLTCSCFFFNLFTVFSRDIIDGRFWDESSTVIFLLQRSCLFEQRYKRS